jgi:hypothetical protein
MQGTTSLTNHDSQSLTANTRMAALNHQERQYPYYAISVIGVLHISIALE